MKKLKEISLFLPAYNEQEVIADTISNADKILKKIATKYEILVVNDGSTDDMAKVVNGIAKKNKNVRMITHRPNRGYGGAIKTGLYKSKYELISFIDADGQFDFVEISKFLPYIDDHDLIIGYRQDRADPFIRKFTAFLLKIWNLFWFRFWVKDTDCGFKVVHRRVVKGIEPLITESAITETEFLIRSKRAGFKFKQVPVTHYPRTLGQSTGGDPKVIFKAIKESLILWRALMFNR